MANHGRTGAALEEYRTKRRSTNRRRVNGAKDVKGSPLFTNGHYDKPSRAKRTKARVEARSKAA